MTILTVSFANVFTGTTPNDGTGDSLYEAFNKVNANFANIATVGFAAGNLSLSGAAEIAGQLTVNDITQSTTTTTGAIVVAGGVGIAKNLFVGGNLSIQGTTTTINTEIVNVEETVIGNSFVRGTLFVGNNAAYTPISYTNPIFVGTSSANTYIQGALQNQSTGTQASTDWIATADNGTDASHYIDLGINGSNYSVATWTVSGANDGYLYINQGNLTLGTDTPNTTVKIHTGGTLAANVVATFNAANTLATSITTGALVVAGGIGSSDTIYGANLVVNGWGNIGNLQAVQIGNVGATHTGTDYFGVGTATFGNVQAVQIGNVSANVTAGNITVNNYANVGNLQAVQIGNVGATHTGTDYFGVGTATFGNIQAARFGNISANISAGNVTVSNYANIGNIQAVQIGNVGTTFTGTSYNATGIGLFGEIDSPIVGNTGTVLTGVLGNVTPSAAQVLFLRTTNTTEAILNAGLHGQGNIGNSTSAYGNIHANSFIAMSSTGVHPPLKFSSGTNVVVPQNGAVEYDGNVFYGTTNSGRGALASKWTYVLSSNVNISNANAAPVLSVPYSLLNGQVATGETPLGFNANVGTYEFEGLFGLITGASPHNINFGFNLSSGTIASIQYEVTFGNLSAFNSNGSFTSGGLTSGNAFTTVFWNNTNGGLIYPFTKATTSQYIKVKGIVRYTASGKLVPSLYFTGTVPGASTLTLFNSYFTVTPLGSSTVTTLGNWT